MSHAGFGNLDEAVRVSLASLGLITVAQDATGRLVRRLNPLRVYLFGSVNRGTATRDSDLDFLVVVPEGSDCRQLMVEGLRELRDLPVAEDVLVTTPSRLEASRNDHGSVLSDVLREGTVLHERGA